MKQHFQYVAPVFRVTDFTAAVAFFEAIGFKKEWSYGDPPCYAGLYSACDHIVHLEVVSVAPSSPQSLYLQVENIDESFACCNAAGLQIASPLATQPYGMRDFTVSGPDGVRVGFGQQLPEA